MNYTKHPLYHGSLKRAKELLQTPENELRAKLRERSGWGADQLPTEEKLAELIIIWVMEENDRRGFPNPHFE